MFSIILLALTFLFILWFLMYITWYKIRINRIMNKVDLLEGELPIIGHSLNYRNCRTSQDFYNEVNTLSECKTEDKRLWLVNQHYLVASKLNTIEKILTSPDAVEKSYFYSHFSLCSDGIFIAPTARWRKLRKRVNTTFTPKYYPDYINQINYQAKIFVDKLKARKENQNKYSNILPIVSRYFLDIVTITHFGVNTKQQYNSETNIVEDITWCTELVFSRIARIWLHPEFIFKRSELYKKTNSILETHRPYLENLIIKSEEFQNKIDSEGNPLGWKSYATHCRELLEGENIKTTPLLIGNTATDLLVAGSDTASVAVSNLLYQLGMNPQYQELAYKEIMEILQEDVCRDSNHLDTDNAINESSAVDNHWEKHCNGDSKINNRHSENLVYSDDADWEYSTNIPNVFGFWTRKKLDRLPFIDMLIKESLRLCSPPVVMRHLNSDIDVGDYTIPKESSVFVLIKSVQRNPLFWEKPEKFYPEHFTPEQVKARPKYAFLPFSQGPRDCPGKLFGMYGMKCALAEIIRNFKIEAEPIDDMKYKFIFMIEQVEGYPVKLVPRNSNNKN